jgi:glycerol 3-phosphatase-1
LSHVVATWVPETNSFRLIIEQPVGRTEPYATPDTTPLQTPAGSRAASFSGGDDRERMRAQFGKPSDELTGNDSVVGSPVASRPGSPGPQEEGAKVNRRPSVQGVTLEAFKRAMSGNAAKRRASRSEINMEE